MARDSRSRKKKASPSKKDGKLRYIPLGGLGEVGKNMYALEYEDSILVVDCGLMFPDEEMFGIALSYQTSLSDREREDCGHRDHSRHEDHIAACPTSCRRFRPPSRGTKLPWEWWKQLSEWAPAFTPDTGNPGG